MHDRGRLEIKNRVQLEIQNKMNAHFAAIYSGSDGHEILTGETPSGTVCNVRLQAANAYLISLLLVTAFAETCTVAYGMEIKDRDVLNIIPNSATTRKIVAALYYLVYVTSTGKATREEVLKNLKMMKDGIIPEWNPLPKCKEYSAASIAIILGIYSLFTDGFVNFAFMRDLDYDPILAIIFTVLIAKLSFFSGFKTNWENVREKFSNAVEEVKPFSTRSTAAFIGSVLTVLNSGGIITYALEGVTLELHASPPAKIAALVLSIAKEMFGFRYNFMSNTLSIEEMHEIIESESLWFKIPSIPLSLFAGAMVIDILNSVYSESLEAPPPYFALPAVLADILSFAFASSQGITFFYNSLNFLKITKDYAVASINRCRTRSEQNKDDMSFVQLEEAVAVKTPPRFYTAQNLPFTINAPPQPKAIAAPAPGAPEDMTPPQAGFSLQSACVIL